MEWINNKKMSSIKIGDMIMMENGEGIGFKGDDYNHKVYMLVTDVERSRIKYLLMSMQTPTTTCEDECIYNNPEQEEEQMRREITGEGYIERAKKGAECGNGTGFYINYDMFSSFDGIVIEWDLYIICAVG